MATTIENDLEKLLRTLAQIYAMQGKRREVTVLAKSQATIEQTDFDNWNGGTYGYTIYLSVKSSLYAQIEEDINQIENDFRDHTEPLIRAYNNEYIQEFVISLEMEDDQNWRHNAVKWLDTAQEPISHKPKQDGGPLYDIFISHATEDKEAVVRPLVNGLSSSGLRVWYDEFELKLGDSLSQSIDHGLANSKYGLVVLSHSFFNKNWPRYELDGLVNRQMVGGKVILPIWHGVSRNDVSSYSPSLADKLSLDTENSSIDNIVKAILDVVGKCNQN